MGQRDFRQSGANPVSLPPLFETHAATSIEPELIRTDQDLVVRLCRMPVDLAAPLLRAALPTLTPQALLALVAATGEAHHRLIAARPGLDWRVVKALLRTQNDNVAATLAHNTTLTFDADDEACLARRALESTEVRQAVLAQAGLRLARAQIRLHDGEDISHSNLKLLALLRGGETAGFVREMARRLKFDLANLSRTLTSPSPVPLALTMCAAGLDRAIFLHLLRHWQAAHDGEPQLTEAQKPLILSVFTLPPAVARQKLAALMAAARA